MPSTIHPRQVRAARALLALSQEQLAEAAQIGIATVKRFESGKATRPEIQRLLRAALEELGVILLDPASSVEGRSIGAGVAVRAKPFAASVASETAPDAALRRRMRSV